MHADKAQLLAKMLSLVGMKVDGEGMSPNPAKGTLDVLLEHQHTTLKDIQKTVGTLQWFRPFIPNFNAITHPLTQLLRSVNRCGNKVEFTDECQIAIQKVKDIILQQPKMVHSDATKHKEVYVTCGRQAFAVSVQQEGQVIQFWSKSWCNNVDNYSKADRMALAVRETIKHFLPVLIGSPSVTFFTNEKTFVALANDPGAWSPLMKTYLSHGTQLCAKYRIATAKYAKDLEILDEPFLDSEGQVSSGKSQLSSLKQTFQLDDEQLSQFPS